MTAPITWPDRITDADLRALCTEQKLDLLFADQAVEYPDELPTERAWPGRYDRGHDYWRVVGSADWLRIPAGVVSVRAYTGHRLRLELANSDQHAPMLACGQVRGCFLYAGIWMPDEIDTDQEVAE